MSNFIQVSEKYAIASDDRNWILQKSGVKTDKETGETSVTWSSFSYPGTLEGAVKSLGQHMLRTSGANSYDELVEAAKKISELFSQNFTVSADLSIKINQDRIK